MDKSDVAMLAAVALVLIFLGTVISASIMDMLWREDSVEQGHAEWYVENHMKKWRWRHTDLPAVETPACGCKCGSK